MLDNYNSLLSPGFHDISIGQLEKIFVAPFNESVQRKSLFERFMVFLSIFNNVGITCEIWIDGSFTTDKHDPSDIDVIFFFDPVEVNGLAQQKKGILSELFGNRTDTKYRYKCDVYFVPNDRVQDRSYWRGWFGFSRDEQPKGIARLIMQQNEYNRKN